MSCSFTLSANSTGAEDDTQVGGLFFFLTSDALANAVPRREVLDPGFQWQWELRVARVVRQLPVVD